MLNFVVYILYDSQSFSRNVFFVSVPDDQGQFVIHSSSAQVRMPGVNQRLK